MVDTNNTPHIPKEFFDEQLKNIAQRAKDDVDNRRGKYLNNADALIRAIDSFASKINKSIRIILRGGGITNKKQLQALCDLVDEELKRDSSLLHFNATEVIELIHSGVDQARKELSDRYAKVIESLPETDNLNTRETFFESLALMGIEEEKVVSEIISKLNSIVLELSQEFFLNLASYNFDDHLSAQELNDFKRLFNSLLGIIRSKIAGTILNNPNVNFEMIKGKILEAINQYKFVPEKLPYEIVELFEKGVLKEVGQCVQAASSINDLWDLSSHTNDETVTCEELKERLCPIKLTFRVSAENENESYPITPSEEAYIMRMYMSMDKGFAAQTMEERYEAIAELSNTNNHAGIKIRTAKEVEKLISSIPAYGTKEDETTDVSAIFDLMQRVDGAAKAPREIGQALIRLREGLARLVEKHHQLRVTEYKEVTELYTNIKDLSTELNTLEVELYTEVQKLSAKSSQLVILAELVELKAETGRTISEQNMQEYAKQFVCFLNEVESLELKRKRLDAIARDVELVQSTLQSINSGIDEGEIFIRTNVKEMTFGADPWAILGEEFNPIKNYEPHTELDLKLGSIETASDLCMKKIIELKNSNTSIDPRVIQQIQDSTELLRDLMGNKPIAELKKANDSKRFSMYQSLTLNYSTAMGSKNRIWGIELPILHTLLSESQSLDSVSEQTIIESLAPVSDLDESLNDSSKLRNRCPKKDERANSSALFIIWKDTSGTVYILPTHKGYEMYDELSPDNKMDKEGEELIRERVKKLRIM